MGVALSEASADCSQEVGFIDNTGMTPQHGTSQLTVCVAGFHAQHALPVSAKRNFTL